ncbi:MAG: Uma2 family endonuclease [Acidobacteriia bacterium]|nr:Uma2 family endonuclease [Terriglobia bacterium]
MASLPDRKTVTYEEWLRMPEVEDAVEEVVNGEIRIMPPAKLKHTRIVTKLYDAIRLQTDSREVTVFSAVFGLIIRRSPLTSRVPDLAVFETRTMVERDGYIHSAPQLVVEVLSPGNTRREREEKLGDYAVIGVPEVWVVSPEGQTVEVLYLEGGALRSAQVVREGALTPRHFPNMRVEVTAIWPD